jgi:hypothetical protein
MNIILLNIVALLCLCGVSYAQVVDDITQLGTSSKMIGMGNIEGFDYSSAAVFENPAGLSESPTLSITAFYSAVMEDVNYLNLAASTHTEFGNFGIGLMQVAVGNIDRVTKDAMGNIQAVGVDQVRDLVIKAAYSPNQAGLIFPDTQIGVSLSYFVRDLVGATGRGASLTAGALYHPPLSPFTISAQVKNAYIVRPLAYSNGTSEQIQPSLVLGSSYMWGDFMYMAQLKVSPSPYPMLKSFGAVFKPKGLLGYLSAGLSEVAATDVQIHKNMTLGAGLEMEGFSLDFAFKKSDFSAQDNIYCLSIHIYN